MTNEDIDISTVEKARSALISGFRWASTAQGYVYWNEVYENLELLLREAEKQNLNQL